MFWHLYQTIFGGNLFDLPKHQIFFICLVNPNRLITKKRSGFSNFRFSFLFAEFTEILFNHESDADSHIILPRTDSENRVVINLNHSKIEPPVNFDVKPAADCRTEVRGLERERESASDRANRCRAARTFGCRASDGKTSKRVKERFEARFRGVVLDLDAAEKIVAGIPVFEAEWDRIVILVENSAIKSVLLKDGGKIAFNAEVARNVSDIRPFHAVRRTASETVALLIGVTAVKLVFLVFVRVGLCVSTDTQDKRQA
jgi:hypothetical protein